MTLDDLKSQCWASLPPIRKRLAGREAVYDLITIAVENWQGEYLDACGDNQQRDVYVASLVGHMKRGHQAISGKEPTEYGFLWAVLLQAVAVAVVQWLVQWWLERRANKVFMAVWKDELTR